MTFFHIPEGAMTFFPIAEGHLSMTFFPVAEGHLSMTFFPIPEGHLVPGNFSLFLVIFSQNRR